jgi:hypothetical protein
MTDTAGLRLVGEEDGETVLEPVAPPVFARSISAPAGPPWDQARAADLEARLSAPLPLSEVLYQLHRLEPWRLGRPARYAATYVRVREVREALEASVEVDGRRLHVRFVSTAEKSRRAKRFGIVAAALAVGVLAAGVAMTTALAMRSQTALRLDALEQTAALRLRQARNLDALDDQTRALNIAHVQGQSLKDYLSDLAWAAAARSPDAHIDSVHWERGLMAVQMRGDVAPFAQNDRTVIKASKPVRPGVWLWGVGPAGLPPHAASPPPEAGP